jgi:hypothetical protein
MGQWVFVVDPWLSKHIRIKNKNTDLRIVFANAPC